MSNFTMYILLAATTLVALFGCRWQQQQKKIPQWKAVLVMIGVLVLINVLMFGLEYLFSR